MPRAGRATKAQKHEAEKRVVVTIDGDAEVIGAFPLVVRSYNGKLPGQEGYEEGKDAMLLGFKYGNSSSPHWMPTGVKKEDVTAYDFLTDPKTGKRAGQALEPHGSTHVGLLHGISNWVDLPPLAIWREGKWLADILWDVNFDESDLPSWLQTKVEHALKDWPKSGCPVSLFPYFVTSGEGTTGNHLYKVYELPSDKCGTTRPHHPMMWPEKDRKPWEFGRPSEYEVGRVTRSTPTTTTPVKKAPPLPAGLRYRCPDCGHWYDQSDLPGHAQVCGKGEVADWAIMCHRDCGCQNLHEASTPKPGFPRPKPVVEEKEAESVADSDGVPEPVGAH